MNIRALRSRLRRAPLYLWRLRVALTPRRVFVTVAVAAVVLGVVGWVLLGSRLLVVRTVQVAGADRVSVSQIRAAASVRLGTPLVRVDVGEVRRRVEAIRRVESAHVQRRWPSTLRISVRERVPIAVVRQGERYLLLDHHGVKVATVPSAPESVPVLEVAEPSPDDPATRAALTVLHGLPERLVSKVTTVYAPVPTEVRLRLRGGDRVIWGNARRGAEKAHALMALLQQEAEVYNVSSPDVATTR